MTAQLPDKITIADVEQNLHTNPLEVYWNLRKKKRPDFCAKRDCLRGYVARWEIADQQLWLNHIDGQIKKSINLFGSKIVDCSLHDFFPRANPGKIKAVWFSGKLRIPLGKMIYFNDSGYDSRFERDLILTIVEGTLIRSVTLDHSDRSLVTIDSQDKAIW